MAAVLHCGCGDGRQMAGWGPEALLAVRMAGRSVAAGEEDMLLRVFARATKIWEHAIGRPLFRVCPSEEAPDHPEDSRITYTIEVGCRPIPLPHNARTPIPASSLSLPIQVARFAPILHLVRPQPHSVLDLYRIHTTLPTSIVRPLTCASVQGVDMP